MTTSVSSTPRFASVSQHRRPLMHFASGALLTLVALTSAHAQSAAEQVALGDKASAARQSAAALDHYESAIKLDPREFTALWKASREAVDIGEAETNDGRRASLNARATDYARRAVALNDQDADAHFHLSRALGRTALTLGPRDRVKYAGEIRVQALRALELKPRHPGALHVMGVWNAEVMRLGGVQRLFAKTFLGGALFDRASWAEATRYMQQAVAVEPDRLIHRLDLARVYRDSKHPADARAEYVLALKAPLADPNDELYRRAAEAELKALR